ncbi:MAG: 50S ribosomal protein L4 [Elusimicrobiota bacterium]|nr:50S ribosomal protein L4 [Elusimicrobiota bacterium]
MNKAKVIEESGQLAGEKTLSADIFGVSYDDRFINEALKEYLRKNFTGSTKTKGEVRGGGRKPYRQKGTGNARQGSIRTPLKPGGGIIFGPRPRVKTNKLSKKKKSAALRHVLSRLASEGKIYFMASAGFKKTGEAVKFLSKSFKKDIKILIVTEKLDREFALPFRNIKNVSLECVSDLNMRKIIYCDAVIFVDGALDGVKA